MADLLAIMFNVIAPIFLVVGLAFYVSRRFEPDPRSISTILVYIFIPALAFDGIARSELDGGEILGLGAMAFGIAFLMALGGKLVARLAGFDRKLESAFLLSVILINAANYGIPLNTFAFGEAGGQRALIYYVMSVMIGNVLGVYFASRGTASVREAALNVLKVPITPAAALGLLVNLADITVPLPLSRAIGLAAAASVPGMLVLLGIQLSRASLRGRWGAMLLASGMRLVVAPILAVPLALLLGLQGVTFQVAVVESSMPTAVLASALATQFGADAEFTAAVTLLSTILSIITLTLLLSLLM